MKRYVKIGLLAFVAAACALAQQSIDNTGAKHVNPWPMVEGGFPGRCTAGERLTRSDQPWGQNDYECGSSNNWIQQASSGGGTSTAPAVFNNTPLPVPNVTLTTSGTNPGASNTYGYSVAWYNLIGYGAYQNEVDIDWADPLTGTNSITLHIGSCPAGALGYIVYRGYPNGGGYTFGLQVQNTCTVGQAVTWTDTGVNNPDVNGQLWSSPNAQYNGVISSWDQSTGLYVPSNFTQGDSGAVTWSFYVGTQPFLARALADIAYSNAKNAFVYYGPTNYAIEENLSSYAMSTDLTGGSELDAIRVGAYNGNPSATADDLGTVTGLNSFSGNGSTGTAAVVNGLAAHCEVGSTGNIQTCIGVNVQNPEIALSFSGGHVVNMRGFSMNFNGDGDTYDYPTASLIGFYSDLNTLYSPDTWQIKMTGDAPSLIGDTVFSKMILLAPTSHGALVWCDDCTVASALSSTCAAAGTGTYAIYKGTWKCVPII